MIRALVVGSAALLGGCILPVSTGAPMPATTVGKGRIGGAMAAEAPVLDLIAENDDGTPNSTSAVSYGAAPAAALNFTVSYGLGDHTDLELTGEGALYYFLIPLPTGASIGLRQHLASGESIDFAIAARVGHVGSTSESEDSSGNKVENGAKASYGAFSAVGQLKHGAMRPLLAVNLMPARISRNFSDPNDPDYKYTGFASSLTFGLMFVTRNVTVGPYVTATNFYSDRFDNVGWFAAGGLMLASRPDRNRKPDPPPPYAPQPYYGPQPGYPQPGYPQPGYPQPGYPQPQPQPPPQPAPPQPAPPQPAPPPPPIVTPP